MSASPHATLVALLMATVLLGISRAPMARADARWTLLTGGLVGLACASLAALYAATGW